MNASTFANETVIGGNPHGIFIDFNNTIFLVAYNYTYTLVWSEGSIYPVRNLPALLSMYTTLFVTINGDIYFESGNAAGLINKWSTNATDSIFCNKIQWKLFWIVY